MQPSWFELFKLHAVFKAHPTGGDHDILRVEQFLWTSGKRVLIPPEILRLQNRMYDGIRTDFVVAGEEWTSNP